MFLRTDNPPLAASVSSVFFGFGSTQPIARLRGQGPTCSNTLNGKEKS